MGETPEVRASLSNARAVLFDLDGTLVDTAPDLAGAANDLRQSQGLPALPQEALRPYASHGARGLIGAALSVAPGDADYETLRDDFLARYEKRLTRLSRVFPDGWSVLDALEAQGRAWGIVTNKATRFTDPLVRALGLHQRAAVIVCGDTTPHTKPHPAPLLYAAGAIALAPSDCIYVGDDARDIAAGHAAGMATVAAAYGYCADSDPRGWQAEAVIDRLADLLPLIG